MILIIVVIILIGFFFTTHYGFKSESKNIRVLAYTGAFLAVALLTLLTFLIVVERLEN